MTGFKFFLDSSIWLGYFLGNLEDAKEFVDMELALLFTSVISIHEIVKKLRKLNFKEKQIKDAVRFIEDNSVLVDVNKKISLNAVSNCEMHKLHTIDSLIYSSAMEIKALFVTADYDFSKTPNTRLIKIN